MDRKKLAIAVDEAKRFMKRAKAFDATSEDYFNPRESGAVRRASMDLTRALADLRRPPE